MSAVYLFADYEAPALYKSGDTYFLFASKLSGWGMSTVFPRIRFVGSFRYNYFFDLERLGNMVESILTCGVVKWLTT